MRRRLTQLVLRASAYLLGAARLARDVVAYVQDDSGPRVRREQRVKSRDTPCVRGRNVEALAHIIHGPFADPTHGPLNALQSGQQQMTPRSHRGAGVAEVSFAGIDP